MKTSSKGSFIFFTLILSISLYSLFQTDDKINELEIYFQNCDYDRAIKTANIILRTPNLTDSDKTQVFLIKGVSEYSSNQLLNAEISFAELISIDENLSLNSSNVSPKVIDFFNEIKKSRSSKN